MPIFQLHARQQLAVDLDTAWQFFADPANLALITPPQMRFRLTCEPPDTIQPGLLITYQLTPLPPLPVEVGWATEIDAVEPPHFFSDTQIHGPYALWRHHHRFREIAHNAIEATDTVHYALPLDPLSGPLHGLMVGPQLRRIFSFRRDVLRDRFGEPPHADRPSLRIRAL